MTEGSLVWPVKHDKRWSQLSHWFAYKLRGESNEQAGNGTDRRSMLAKKFNNKPVAKAVLLPRKHAFVTLSLSLNMRAV